MNIFHLPVLAVVVLAASAQVSDIFRYPWNKHLNYMVTLAVDGQRGRPNQADKTRLRGAIAQIVQVSPAFFDIEIKTENEIQVYALKDAATKIYDHFSVDPLLEHGFFGGLKRLIPLSPTLLLRVLGASRPDLRNPAFKELHVVYEFTSPWVASNPKREEDYYTQQYGSGFIPQVTNMFSILQVWLEAEVDKVIMIVPESYAFHIGEFLKFQQFLYSSRNDKMTLIDVWVEETTVTGNTAKCFAWPGGKPSKENYRRCTVGCVKCLDQCRTRNWGPDCKKPVSQISATP